MTLIAPTLQVFFTDRLTRQRQASPRTIAAYRDALRLLLGFVQQRTGTRPEKMDWSDLNADVISAFLNYLEDERGNSARTRNVRLTAIRSLFSYAALQHPEHALLIQRVLDIPPKRYDKRTVTFLTADEVDALLRAPNPQRWEGRRDKAILAPRRRRPAPEHPRVGRGESLSVPAGQARPSSRPAPQLRDVATAGWSRHHSHRAVARPRRRSIHRCLCPRRHDHQGTSPRPDHADGRPARPIPAQ